MEKTKYSFTILIDGKYFISSPFTDDHVLIGSNDNALQIAAFGKKYDRGSVHFKISTREVR